MYWQERMALRTYEDDSQFEKPGPLNTLVDMDCSPSSPKFTRLMWTDVAREDLSKLAFFLYQTRS